MIMYFIKILFVLLENSKTQFLIKNLLQKILLFTQIIIIGRVETFLYGSVMKRATVEGTNCFHINSLSRFFYKENCIKYTFAA